MSTIVIPKSTRAIVVQNHITTAPILSGPDATFELKTISLPESIPTDSLLVQSLYVSNDPGTIWFIKKDVPLSAGISTLPVGTTFKALTISRVLQVGGDAADEKFKVGTLVAAFTEWAEYAVVKKAEANAVQELPGLSPTVWLGALGSSGLTAYFGLLDILKLKENDTLVVSGAAGAVGNVVVQYAKKVIGARVIAIAGGPKKVEWLKSIGADVTVDYKSPTFREDLEKATPDLATAYFDNVGGSITDEVIVRLKPHSRIAACGSISTYTDPSAPGLRNYMVVVAQRLTISGFMLPDYLPRFEEAIPALLTAVKDGKIDVSTGETVVDIVGRIEELPRVWKGLFEGTNVGKLVSKLA